MLLSIFAHIVGFVGGTIAGLIIAIPIIVGLLSLFSATPSSDKAKDDLSVFLVFIFSCLTALSWFLYHRLLLVI